MIGGESEVAMRAWILVALLVGCSGVHTPCVVCRRPLIPMAPKCYRCNALRPGTVPVVPTAPRLSFTLIEDDRLHVPTDPLSADGL